MENYDPRRRQSSEDRERYANRGEDRGRDRAAWRPHDDDRSRRRAGEQTGWLDYDRDYGRADDRIGDRGSEEPRYGQERSNFSPDWSREGAEPRYSDDRYYSRNQQREESGEQPGGGRAWQDDDRSRWEQRARSSIPREQRQIAERSRPGEPYYQGYYSRYATPVRYPGGSGMVYSESLTLHGPYTGRGPKGYKRSDQQIIEEASQRLERDGEIDATGIEVLAEDGIITLRGTVDDRATKRRAEECVESVYGVRDVMNELRVSSLDREGPRGSGRSQGSQKSRAPRGSQTSQASQTGQGTQAGGTEQSGEGERVPKH
jgi:hypothetical protein